MTTTWLVCLLFLVHSRSILADSPIPVTIPAIPSPSHVVSPNFFGLSFELSFVDQYFGNDTQSIPQPFVNYLSSLRNRFGQPYPFRSRIGGNSMDTSTYNASQSFPMLQLTDPQANVNNQPVTYGPLLWDVLSQAAQNVQGIHFLLGLSLLDPNDPTVALAAHDSQAKLGDSLDGFTLGNEPDLYTPHHMRLGLDNYTLEDYFTDFSTAASHLTNGSTQNSPFLAGPSICCAWDLAPVLQGGYLSMFSNLLKYITVQHYPQTNCFDSYEYDVTYYQQHASTVALAAWQQSGIDMAVSQLPVLMSEFNSASCGGISGISDTFVVGSMWTTDYALQMAATGYSGAFMHTRESGIPYNAFNPPTGGIGPWVTNPTFYSLLVVGETLQSQNGSIVVDLNIANSTMDLDATVAGYAAFDAQSHSVYRLVLFNYANATAAQFALPANVFTGDAGKNVTVKLLSAASPVEMSKISWDGQTLEGVGDGVLVPVTNQDNAWSVPSQNMDCTNGCQVEVPAPGIAVVFVGGVQVQSTNTTAPPHVHQSGLPANSNATHRTSPSGLIVTAFSAIWTLYRLFY